MSPSTLGYLYVKTNIFVQGTILRKVYSFGSLDSEMNQRFEEKTAKPLKSSKAFCGLTEVSPLKPSLYPWSVCFICLSILFGDLGYIQPSHQNLGRIPLSFSWENPKHQIAVFKTRHHSSSVNVLIHNQMHWARHFIRMEDIWLPKQQF